MLTAYLPFLKNLFVLSHSSKLLLFTLFFLTTLDINDIKGQSPVNFIKSKLIIESNIKKYEFVVDVALSPSQQSRGLMFRHKLDTNSGMLFFHQREIVASMWMHNTYIPLDMLFIDSSGKIVHIFYSATPHSQAIISYDQPVRAVLELAAGVVNTHGIRIGDEVKNTLFNNTD
jgi:uncharacterized membrane protein (UPF0127 family)